MTPALGHGQQEKRRLDSCAQNFGKRTLRSESALELRLTGHLMRFSAPKYAARAVKPTRLQRKPLTKIQPPHFVIGDDVAGAAVGE